MSNVPIYWRGKPGWRDPEPQDGNTIAAWCQASRWLCLEYERGWWRQVSGMVCDANDIEAWLPLPNGFPIILPGDQLPATLAALHHSREALDRAIAAVEKLTEGRKDWQ